MTKEQAALEPRFENVKSKEVNGKNHQDDVENFKKRKSLLIDS